MLHNYYIELEIHYPKNSKGNPHAFTKVIKHIYSNCDFYIIQKSLIIEKDFQRHEYDLTEIVNLQIRQMFIQGKERFTI